MAAKSKFLRELCISWQTGTEHISAHILYICMYVYLCVYKLIDFALIKCHMLYEYVMLLIYIVYRYSSTRRCKLNLWQESTFPEQLLVDQVF